MTENFLSIYGIISSQRRKVPRLIIFYISRCFFLLDKTSPSFSPHKSPYSQQLRQDLVINIYHDGEWGGLHSVSLDCAGILGTQTVDSHLLSIQWYVSCMSMSELRNISYAQSLIFS
jgi:hypothetical protein